MIAEEEEKKAEEPPPESSSAAPVQVEPTAPPIEAEPKPKRQLKPRANAIGKLTPRQKTPTTPPRKESPKTVPKQPRLIARSDIPPRPATPLPEFISQFIGLEWFDKYFPNCNENVSSTQYIYQYFTIKYSCFKLSTLLVNTLLSC